MVTDQQVRRLFKLVQTEKNFGIAAIKAGMDEKREGQSLTGCCLNRYFVSANFGYFLNLV